MIKNIFTKLDSHMQEIVRGTFLAFILKLLGSGLVFGFNVAIARLLGVEGSGVFFLAFSITSIGTVIGRVGLDSTLLRFVATYATHEEWGKVKGVYSLSMRLAVFSSSICSIFIYLIAPWIAEFIFSKPELADPLRWMSLSIVPFSLLNLQAESLKGLKHIRSAMLIQSIGPPLLSLLFIYPLVLFAGVIGAALAYTIGAIAITIVGMIAWHQAISYYNCSVSKFPFKELWMSCRPLFIVSFLNIVVRNGAPIILLGIWATSNDVGIYGAASRLVAIISMMLFSLNNVLAPKIAELYVKGDMSALALTAKRSAVILFVLASPFFLLLIFGSSWVMSIYGSEFKDGGIILCILTLGQLVNVFAGSLSIILIVSGNEGYIQNMTLLFSSIMLIMLVVLIPNMGVIGAALSVTISGLALSVTTVWQAKKIIGLSVIPSITRIWN